VFKEFLTSLAKEVFDSDRGLWLSTEQHELYPNPHSYATDGMMDALYTVDFNADRKPSVHSLAWFRFVGRILGKALYEGILVDVAFAGFFLAKVGWAVAFKDSRMLTDITFTVAREAKLFG
jgi:ubiquitin-protein ligase E3 C